MLKKYFEFEFDLSFKWNSTGTSGRELCFNKQRIERAITKGWRQCRNLHVGVPGYRPPKMISIHFYRLVPILQPLPFKGHLKERLKEKTVGY